MVVFLFVDDGVDYAGDNDKLRENCIKIMRNIFLAIFADHFESERSPLRCDCSCTEQDSEGLR